MEKVILTAAFAPVPTATLSSPPVSDTPLPHGIGSNYDDMGSQSERADSIELVQIQTLEAPEDTPVPGIPEMCAGCELPMRRCAPKQCAVCSIWIPKGMIQFHVCCATLTTHFRSFDDFAKIVCASEYKTYTYHPSFHPQCLKICMNETDRCLFCPS